MDGVEWDWTGPAPRLATTADPERPKTDRVSSFILLSIGVRKPLAIHPGAKETEGISLLQRDIGQRRRQRDGSERRIGLRQPDGCDHTGGRRLHRFNMPERPARKQLAGHSKRAREFSIFDFRFSSFDCVTGNG